MPNQACPACGRLLQVPDGEVGDHVCSKRCQRTIDEIHRLMDEGMPLCEIEDRMDARNARMNRRDPLW